MQDERIRGGVVCVSRDGGGDWRRVLVPVAETRFAHMAVSRGGDCAALDPPQLAVYVDSGWFPEAWRSGKHGGGSMKLLVEREHTEPAVYELLRAEGERRVYSRGFAERKRRRHRERAALAATGKES